MNGSGKTTAASVGAAAILGMPVLAGAAASGADPTPPSPEPAGGASQRRAVEAAPSYTELERQLHQANRRVRFWRGKARRNWRVVYRLRSALRESVDPVRLGLMCIHGGEGSWSDHGAPYWGGLQMDVSFMRTYGSALVQRLGTADRWPAGAQLAVAEVAYYSGRGYGPWPNTRRACGL